MSLKNKDDHNRWRNKTVAFRVSPEEWEQIERYVQLSGLTKQDHITRRLTNKEVVVQGNTRVYKALVIISQTYLLNYRGYISADYDQHNGDQDVVNELNKWGSDNLHKVEFIDMSNVSSGSVANGYDCRICDLKSEFNRQINACIY